MNQDENRIQFWKKLVSKLRILVGADVPPDPNSGAAGTVYQTNLALRELGHEVDELWANDIGRRIRHGNAHYLLELPHRFRKLVRLRCDQKRYDVIQLDQPHAYLAAKDHRNSKRSGIFVNRSHGLELRVRDVLPYWEKLYGVNRKGFVRDSISKGIQRQIVNQWRQVANFSDGIIMPCHQDAAFLIDSMQIDKSKVQVILQGVSGHLLSDKPQEFQSERSNKILYVGQYTFMKGPDVLTEIVNRLLYTNSSATFTWVCSKAHHEVVLANINKEHLQRFSIVDWMPQEKLSELYGSHGIFIFPSFFEGFGKVALEAMASGMCVIASDTGGMRDFICADKNGFLVPVGDIDGFVNRALLVLGDPSLCTSIGKCAKTDVRKFTWEKCARESVEFYAELIKRQIRV